MKLLDCLDLLESQTELRLPQPRSPGSLADHLAAVFEAYKQCLQGLPGDAGLLVRRHAPSAERLCTAIVAAVASHVAGDEAAAADVLGSALEEIDRLPGLTYLNDSRFKTVTTSNLEGALYRVRTFDGPLRDPEDLFHVPFQAPAREQRYSVAGKPCLYLANSIDTCLREVGTVPATHEVYVSRLQLDMNLRLLDFTEEPSLFIARTRTLLRDADAGSRAAIEDGATARFAVFFLTLPLTIACSVVSSATKEEYIIPHLAAVWATRRRWPNGEVVGVRYFSTRVDANRLGWRNWYVNYALPTRSSKTHGYCDWLAGLVCATRPVALSAFKLSPAAAVGISELEWERRLQYPALDLREVDIGGRTMPYRESLHGRLEYHLCQQPVSGLVP